MKLKGKDEDVVGIWNLSEDEEKPHYLKCVSGRGRILALNFGPFANGPLILSNSRCEILMWQTPFVSHGTCLGLENEDVTDAAFAVSGLTSEPNWALWSKIDGDSCPRRVDFTSTF